MLIMKYYSINTADRESRDRRESVFYACVYVESDKCRKGRTREEKKVVLYRVKYFRGEYVIYVGNSAGQSRT